MQKKDELNVHLDYIDNNVQNSLLQARQEESGLVCNLEDCHVKSYVEHYR